MSNLRQIVYIYLAAMVIGREVDQEFILAWIEVHAASFRSLYESGMIR